MPDHDPVNSPAHYHPGTIEVIDAAEAWGLDRDAYLFNVVKYVARAGRKDPARTLDDLRKAAWYLSRRIARMESEPTPCDTPS